MISSMSVPSMGTTVSTPKSRLWSGRVLWVLSVPFMLMDCAMHIANPAFVQEASQKIGLNPAAIRPIGIVETIAPCLYLVPRTAPLGAVLLTGFFGGAVATHVLTGGDFGIAILVAGLLWGSLYCRDERVRNLVP